MANSLARSFTDYRADETRKAAPKEAAHFLDLAVRGRTAERAVELAVTVASPTEKDAPVVADTVALIRKNQPKPSARASAKAKAEGAAELAGAERIAENFARPQAR